MPGTVLYPKAVRLSKKLRFNIFLLQSLLFPAFVSPVMHNTSLALTDRCLSDCWETLFCFLFCIFATLFHFFSSPQGVCWDEVKVHVLVSLKRGFVNQCHHKKERGLHVLVLQSFSKAYSIIFAYIRSPIYIWGMKQLSKGGWMYYWVILYICCLLHIWPPRVTYWQHHSQWIIYRKLLGDWSHLSSLNESLQVSWEERRRVERSPCIQIDQTFNTHPPICSSSSV